jgi:hypothetical protein
LKSTALHAAYLEFEKFYLRERDLWVAEDQARDGWASRNPRRLFGLAVHEAGRTFGGRLPASALLDAAYVTLGLGTKGRCLPSLRDGRLRPGLFQTFDPKKYTKGRRTLPDHFAGMFKNRLKTNLRRWLRFKTDNGRRDPKRKFRHNPRVGLFRRDWSPGPRLVDTVREALGTLDGRERVVIELTYWADLSSREIGDLLDLDHKAVLRKHNAALVKLRVYYDAGREAA